MTPHSPLSLSLSLLLSLTLSHSLTHSLTLSLSLSLSSLFPSYSLCFLFFDTRGSETSDKNDALRNKRGVPAGASEPTCLPQQKKTNLRQRARLTARLAVRTISRGPHSPTPASLLPHVAWGRQRRRLAAATAVGGITDAACELGPGGHEEPDELPARGELVFFSPARPSLAWPR